MDRDLAREKEFGTGLGRIVKACRQEVDGATLEVYTEALCYQVDLDEWDRFTRETVARGMWTWFPRFSDLRAAYLDFAGHGEPAYRALPRARGDVERELGRAEAVRGVELCRAAFERATGEKAPGLRTFPRVELTEERREELKRSLLDGEER